MARIVIESEDGRVQIELRQDGEDSYEWSAYCNRCPRDPDFCQPVNLLADSRERYNLDDATEEMERHADEAHPAPLPRSYFDERPF